MLNDTQQIKPHRNYRKFALLLFFSVAIISIFLVARWILIGENESDLYRIKFDLSRSGKEIVFCSSGVNKNQRDVYILNLLDKKVSRLTNTPEIEKNPVFSPEGDRIAYSERGKGRAELLFSISKSGGKPKQLTWGNQSDLSPRFSSDGSSIFFSRSNTFRLGGMSNSAWHNYDIFKIRPDGNGLKRMTQGNFIKLENINIDYNGEFISCSVPKPNINFRAIILKIHKNSLKIISEKSLCDYPNINNDKYIVIRYDSPYSNSKSFISIIKFDGSSEDIIGVDNRAKELVVSNDRKYAYFLLYEKANSPSLWKVDLVKKKLKKIAGNKLFDEPLNWTP